MTHNIINADDYLLSYKHFDQARWKNFSVDELKCRCGVCKIIGGYEPTLKIHLDSLDRLQKIRNRFGKPMPITSATRCRNHPLVMKKFKKRGKAGAHFAGMAFDVFLLNRSDFKVLKKLARAAGARGIGDASNKSVPFIHIDWWDERTKFTTWNYGK